MMDDMDAMTLALGEVITRPEFTNNGVCDYPRVQAAVVTVMAQFMVGQPGEVAQQMQDAFRDALRAEVRRQRMPQTVGAVG
jgi:hypothetical protein